MLIYCLAEFLQQFKYFRIMLEKRKKNLKYILVFLSIFSYFLLFYFKDYSIAGAQVDFRSFYFNNIQFFKEDFYNSIVNYGLLGDANYPLDYIFHAFLNPFSFDKDLYLLSTLFIGFFVFIIFAISLEKINFSKIDSYSIGSLILLLPWFSGRAYWGTSAVLGIFFLTISFYFFIKIKNSHNDAKTLDLILLCIFSSAALYTRNSFVFFPIFIIFFLFLNQFNFKKIFLVLINYFILAIPGLLLIFIWGGFYDSKNMDIYEMHNFRNILKNFPIILNYIFFYLWPIFLLEEKRFNLKKFLIKHQFSFLISIITLLILSLLGHMNYLSDMVNGGGVILEFGSYIGDKLNLIFLITSSIGFSFLYYFLKQNFKNNIILFLPIFLIFGHPKVLYQDYFEPLIFIMFFLGIICNKFDKIIYKNFIYIYVIYFVYFVIYNYSAIIYKNSIIS